MRKQRHGRGFSQELLAGRAKINRKHLSELERGEHDLRVSTLDKLRRGLGLPWDAFGAAVGEELALLEASEDRPG